MPGALTEATCASQARIHYRGQIIFGQDSVVKGLYVLRHGSANMQHVQMVQEAELRFPGRDDLMMEEELEYKIKDVERKVPLGDSREGAVFGEAPAHQGWSGRRGNAGGHSRLFPVCRVDGCHLFYPLARVSGTVGRSKEQNFGCPHASGLCAQ